MPFCVEHWLPRQPDVLQKQATQQRATPCCHVRASSKKATARLPLEASGLRGTRARKP
jgi:hypothetical protein